MEHSTHHPRVVCLFVCSVATKVIMMRKLVMFGTMCMLFVIADHINKNIIMAMKFSCEICKI